MAYYYKGVNTKNLYSYNSPLLDANGRAVTGGQNSVAFTNGEEVIVANRDGSVARATAGPGVQQPSSQSGIGNITLPTVTPSPWDMAIPFIGQTGGLPSSLPMILGTLHA